MRRVLTPRWVALHVLALLAVAVQLRLAVWQWSRAHGGGGLQSLGYAVQWPAFACFTVFFWLRFIRDELRGVTRQAPKALDREALAAACRDADEAADDADDPELAAYNAYLRDLAARPRR